MPLPLLRPVAVVFFLVVVFGLTQISDLPAQAPNPVPAPAPGQPAQPQKPPAAQPAARPAAQPQASPAAQPKTAPAVTQPPVVELKSLDDVRAIEAKVRAVVAKVLPCTVGVRIGQAAGSGVIVSEDGLVLTAGHVVGKPGQDVVFIFADGKTVKGKTLGIYEIADAGMMKITEAGKWPFAECGKSDDLALGAWCLATGHPLGYQQGRPPVVRVGRLLRNRDTSLQTDCPLVGGDSGGPLFDLQGRVIGINSRIGPTTEVNLHVPVDVFRQHWDKLAKGETVLDALPGRETQPMKALFRQVVADARKATVRIKCNGNDAALGTIVGPDGWIVTKESELKGKIVCMLGDGRELEARVVGVSKPFDVAMLKVEAAELPAAAWSTAQPAVGQWLAVAGTGDEPVALGVVSVPPRRIPPMSGVLGVSLKIDEKGPARIEKVLPGGAAEKAGLKDGDIVTHVDGKPVATSAELSAAIRTHKPGENVRLNVKRGDQALAIPVKLATLENQGTQKRDFQNRSGVGISARHDDFPTVLQHDAVLRPVDCGGPLVDLSGKVVGVNIARGGRTETYSVPTAVLLEQMYDLMSGRLNPAKLAAEKAAAEKAAQEKTTAEKAALEQRLAAEKAARDKAAADKAAADKAAAEKKAADEKAAQDKAAAERKMADEKAAAEKAAQEKAAAEKKAADEKAAAEKAAAEKAAAEKAAAEKAAQEKAAQEKAAAEKAAAEKAAAEKKAAEDAAKQTPPPGK